jgi:DNA adenine methylase
MNKAQPFLKWVGGKSRLIPQYQPHFPAKFDIYFEPFLGGGAVFFHLNPRTAMISDLNPELINTYNCIGENLEELIALLQKHKASHSAEYYQKIRMGNPRDRTERAARFIYLNKTCFNALYRVNKAGQFNVPMGKYKNPGICNEPVLRAASEVLQSESIACYNQPYTNVQIYAGKGDFVYFDPPYHPISETSKFTSYTKDSFGKEDQVILRDLFAELARKGVKVMLSNSYCDFVKDLYRDFSIHEITAARSINCNRTKRGAIKELLITSY